VGKYETVHYLERSPSKGPFEDRWYVGPACRRVPMRMRPRNSTTNPDRVTCQHCLRSKAWKDAKIAKDAHKDTSPGN